MGEKFRVPVQVNGCKMSAHGLKVDPENAIIVLLCYARIVIQRPL